MSKIFRSCTHRCRPAFHRLYISTGRHFLTVQDRPGSSTIVHHDSTTSVLVYYKLQCAGFAIEVQCGRVSAIEAYRRKSVV